MLGGCPSVVEVAVLTIARPWARRSCVGLIVVIVRRIIIQDVRVGVAMLRCKKENEPCTWSLVVAAYTAGGRCCALNAHPWMFPCITARGHRRNDE